MAQQQGVDYSTAYLNGHVTGASIAAAGLTFVMRYLTTYTGAGSKVLKAGEVANLHAAGLSIGVVFEDYGNPLDNWGGVNISNIAAYNGGVADATTAVNQANTLGFPADRPIYVAVEIFNEPPLPSQNTLNKLVQYFSGWVATIGLGRVGFYGGSVLWNYLFPTYVSGFFWESAAISYSNYQVLSPGAIMQQGLGSPVGGAGQTDPDTAYVADFGQWPNAPQIVTPPPVHSGATFIADVSNDTFYDQPETQSLLTPNESHDQVVYSVTTTDATLANGVHNGFYFIPTPINQTAYPIGTFSFDGGQTYNDFGFQLPTIPGGTGVYPAVTLQPIVDSTGGISFDGVNNTGSTVNLIINIALLASYAPKALPRGSQILDSDISYTNIYPKLTSDDTTRVYSTYHRIAQDTVSGTGNPTIAHGQGQIPNIMFWVNVSGNTTINPIGWQSTGSLGPLGIKMDSNNLYFHVDAGTYSDCYFRVYRDN